MKTCKYKAGGCITYSDQKDCPACDGKDWPQVDPVSMPEGNWDLLFSCAVTCEDKFRIAEAWAETGAAEGIKLLSQMYMEGNGCAKDEKKSVDLLQPLAKRKDPEALTILGSCCIFGTGTEKDPEKGLDMLWKAQAMENGDAAYLLGLLYENGNVVAQDDKKAKRLFKLAAEYGSNLGMLSHGLALLKKAKTGKDINDAIFLLWRAASNDLGEAQLALGVIMNELDSPICDEDQAIYWLNRAVENKCDGAASALATTCLDRFIDGNGETFDLDDLILKLKEALNRGDCAAAKTLGDFYRDGIIDEPDLVRAYKHYRIGQGKNMDCSAAVAHCYHYGHGVEKNISLAYLILTEMINIDARHIAADVPSSAIIELGDMYRDGEATHADPRMAVNLYAIADSRGDPGAMGRIAREILTGNEHVVVKGEIDPIAILKSACDNGDFDSALFLAKHYMAAGDREQATHFMKEALFREDNYTGSYATEFARENFPELIAGRAV